MAEKIRYPLLVVLLIFITALPIFSCRRSGVPEIGEKLRIAIYPDTISALIYIAQDQGFFKRNGLDVSLEQYQTGVLAVIGLVAGKADAAPATEFVLTIQGFKMQDLRAVAAISFPDAMEAVARRDRGVSNPRDMRGKLIGVTKPTIAAFFLNTFLSLNGILPSEVRIIDLNPADLVKTLTEGKIDAAACFPPFSDTMKRNLGVKAISWPIQNGQAYHLIVIVEDELIKTRPRSVDSFLKGLIDAENFLKQDENRAKTIVERKLGIDPASIASTWSKTRFSVRLDQSLLTLLEEEGRWAIRNKLVEGQKLANYLNYFYLDGLLKLKPDAVSVIR
jgi:ABC-type nitrate/sulfonate/bicarbonate transport system substrate-binding protein